MVMTCLATDATLQQGTACGKVGRMGPGDARSFYLDIVTCEACRDSKIFKDRRASLGVAIRDRMVPLPNESGTILDEAAQITSKDRQAQYGPPENSFKAIADMWNAYLGATWASEVRRSKLSSPATTTPLTARNVSMMMVLMKVARDANGAKRDNLVDIAGYARCAEMMGS